MQTLQFSNYVIGGGDHVVTTVKQLTGGEFRNLTDMKLQAAALLLVCY